MGCTLEFVPSGRTRPEARERVLLELVETLTPTLDTSPRSSRGSITMTRRYLICRSGSTAAPPYGNTVHRSVRRFLNLPETSMKRGALQVPGEGGH